MQIKWIPVDFTALKPEQQENMFFAWCRLVMGNLNAFGATGVLKYDFKGDSGMAQERIMQGANVWVEVRGRKFKTNLHVTLNDMLEQDFPKQGSDVRRNDPVWYAGSLVERAKDWELFPPPVDTYGVLPWPADPDIEV